MVTRPSDHDLFDEVEAGPSGSGLSAPSATSAGLDAEEGGTSRLNLRLPDPLKNRIEEAARSEGLSLNAWIVRVAAAAIGPDAHLRYFQRRVPERQPAIHGMGAMSTAITDDNGHREPSRLGPPYPPREEPPCQPSTHQGQSRSRSSSRCGDVHLIASDRNDTVVAVNPSDRSRKPDLDVARRPVSNSPTATFSSRRPNRAVWPATSAPAVAGPST